MRRFTICSFVSSFKDRDGGLGELVHAWTRPLIVIHHH
jgi:hypothetical protein